MSNRRATLSFLVLAFLVWVISFYQAQADRIAQSQPRAARQWHARYAKMLPYLEGIDRVGFVQDPTEHQRGRARFFRAQYVLAPTILRLWPSLPSLQHRRLSFVYDFKDPANLDAVLSDLATEAEHSEVAFNATRVARGLALVTMKSE